MANLNKVILIGRLTRDPEARMAGSSRVCKIGFAVTNRKKNSQTGAWEDDPMFIDVEVWNSGENRKTADLVADRCRKGSQIMVEGRLILDKWQDKTTGQDRTKHKIVADNIQLLDPRTDGGGGSYGGGQASRPPANRGGSGFSGNPHGDGGDDGGGMDDAPPPNTAGGTGAGGGGDDIPF